MSQDKYFLLRHGSDEKFVLTSDKEKFYIGRSVECDFTFTSVFVSRRHCEISRIPDSDDALQMKNISTTNRTYINHMQLNNDDVAKLQVGCLIGLGIPTEFVSEDNPDYIFLELCKEVITKQVVKPFKQIGMVGHSSPVIDFQTCKREIPIKKHAASTSSGPFSNQATSTAHFQKCQHAASTSSGSCSNQATSTAHFQKCQHAASTSSRSSSNQATSSANFQKCQPKQNEEITARFMLGGPLIFNNPKLSNPLKINHKKRKRSMSDSQNAEMIDVDSSPVNKVMECSEKIAKLSSTLPIKNGLKRESRICKSEGMINQELINNETKQLIKKEFDPTTKSETIIKNETGQFIKNENLSIIKKEANTANKNIKPLVKEETKLGNRSQINLLPQENTVNKTLGCGAMNVVTNKILNIQSPQETVTDIERDKMLSHRFGSPLNDSEDDQSSQSSNLPFCESNQQTHFNKENTFLKNIGHTDAALLDTLHTDTKTKSVASTNTEMPKDIYSSAVHTTENQSSEDLKSEFSSNKEYEYIYGGDFEDYSLLEEVVVDEQISKYSIVKPIELDIKPDVEALHASINYCTSVTSPVEAKKTKSCSDSETNKPHVIKNDSHFPKEITDESHKFDVDESDNSDSLILNNNDHAGVQSKSKELLLKSNHPMVSLPIYTFQNLKNNCTSDSPIGNNSITSSSEIFLKIASKDLNVVSSKRCKEHDGSSESGIENNHCKKICKDFVVNMTNIATSEVRTEKTAAVNVGKTSLLPDAISKLKETVGEAYSYCPQLNTNSSKSNNVTVHSNAPEISIGIDNFNQTNSAACALYNDDTAICNITGISGCERTTATNENVRPIADILISESSRAELLSKTNLPDRSGISEYASTSSKISQANISSLECKFGLKNCVVKIKSLLDNEIEQHLNRNNSIDFSESDTDCEVSDLDVIGTKLKLKNSNNNNEKKLPIDTKNMCLNSYEYSNESIRYHETSNPFIQEHSVNLRISVNKNEESFLPSMPSVIKNKFVDSIKNETLPLKVSEFVKRNDSSLKETKSNKQNSKGSEETVDHGSEICKHLLMKQSKNTDIESTNDTTVYLKKENPVLNTDITSEESAILSNPSTSDSSLALRKIKEEPTENETSCNSDNDDDDISFINYSQIDDVIYISSDEENDSLQDCTSTKDVSFGPLPPSPDRDLEVPSLHHDLGKIDESDRSFSINGSGKSCATINSVKQFVDDPSTSNDDGNNIPSIKYFSEENLLSDDENLLSDDENRMSDDEKDWWPVLSQEFDSENYFDNIGRNKPSVVNKETSDFTDGPNGKSDLKHVIEKVRSREVGKTKYTEPQAPLLRKKLNKVSKSKNSKVLSSSVPTVSSTKAVSTKISNSCFSSTLDKNSSNIGSEQNNWIGKSNNSIICKRISKSPSVGKRKKSSHDIRQKLIKTHNLDPYKKIAGTKGKERHHLISKLNIDKLEKPIQPTIKQSSNHDGKKSETKRLVSSVIENVSVKPKTSVKKGVAKISKVSRSQKLTEVNLFKSPSKPKSKSSTKFKIPKKSTKFLEAPNGNEENSLSIGFKFATSVVEKRLPVVAQQFSNSDKTLTIPLPEEMSTSLKSILKSPSKHPSRGPRNRVRFPNYDEDLCKIKIISPRNKNAKNCFSGPDDVKLKEMFVKENLQNIISSCNRMENPQEFIYNICKWNYDWLLTYQKAKNDSNCTKPPNPPQVCESTMLPTLIVYDTYDVYKEVFSNLMYYETWENVYRDWEQYLSTNVWFQSLVDSIQTGFIKTNQKPLKYFSLKLVLPIRKELSLMGKHPNLGSLIAMKYKHNNKTIRAFGYVTSVVKKTSLRYMPHELKAICKNNEDTVLHLTIIFSKLHLENAIKCGLFVSVSNVSYIKPSLRAYEGLCLLKKSSLCPFLLNPGYLNSLNNGETNTSYVVPEIPINDVQKNAVVKVSDKCINSLTEPMISLIHGPPGTGKTRTISALVSQINILYKEKKLRSRRILLCAPSNAAVDELTFRLMKLKEVNINLNIVRVGVRQSIGQQVYECSLDCKVQKEYERRITQNQNPAVKKQLLLSKEYALRATNDYEKAIIDKKSVAEINQLKIRMVELLRSEKDLNERSKNYLHFEERAKLQNECKKMVLMQAEVITCTLNSCLSGAIYDIFSSQPCSFACCIVDEAGQCKETETWMPLQLGINKLVLVGDHMQLPATVLSNVAQGKKLHQSLFERVYHHVGLELQNMSAIHSLTLQYRMHEDICSWPSSHFYYNTLITAPGITQDRKCFLKPYILFDLEDSQEINQSQGDIYNMVEVQAIVSIIDCIATQITHYSVGILTPYQKQKIFLNEKLRSYNKLKITVSTIDNFQGQEKDIIICSFVRANVNSKLGFVSDRQRLNVALTRARRAVFIVGHIQSLKSNADWRSLLEDAQRRKLIHRVDSKLLARKKDLHKIIESKW